MTKIRKIVSMICILLLLFSSISVIQQQKVNAEPETTDENIQNSEWIEIKNYDGNSASAEDYWTNAGKLDLLSMYNEAYGLTGKMEYKYNNIPATKLSDTTVKVTSVSGWLDSWSNNIRLTNYMENLISKEDYTGTIVVNSTRASTGLFRILINGDNIDVPLEEGDNTIDIAEFSFNDSSKDICFELDGLEIGTEITIKDVQFNATNPDWIEVPNDKETNVGQWQLYAKTSEDSDSYQYGALSYKMINDGTALSDVLVKVRSSSGQHDSKAALMTLSDYCKEKLEDGYIYDVSVEYYSSKKTGVNISGDKKTVLLEIAGNYFRIPLEKCNEGETKTISFKEGLTFRNVGEDNYCDVIFNLDEVDKGTELYIKDISFEKVKEAPTQEETTQKQTYEETTTLENPATQETKTPYVPKGNNIELNNWSFYQAGNYRPDEEQYGNAGYINSVSMANTNEELTGWLRSDNYTGQTQTASDINNGFTLDIETNGWDADWYSSPFRIKPFSIQAHMNNIGIIKNHSYTIRFKAKASKHKYVALNLSDYYDNIVMQDNSIKTKIIDLYSDYREYEIQFTNTNDLDRFNFNMRLGAFQHGSNDGKVYDEDGNDISSSVQQEVCWNGTVDVKDFEIIDNDSSTSEETTVESTQESTTEEETTAEQSTQIIPGPDDLDYMYYDEFGYPDRSKIRLVWGYSPSDYDYIDECDLYVDGEFFTHYSRINYEVGFEGPNYISLYDLGEGVHTLTIKTYGCNMASEQHSGYSETEVSNPITIYVDYSTINWDYIVEDDDSVTITDYIGNEEDVNVPSIIAGKTVKKIGSNISDGIKKITIPSTVTEIGDSAFIYSNSLKEVKLSDGLKKIGECAFSNCINLEKVEIPNSVEEIGDSAFSCCESIERIELPSSLNSISNDLFYGCISLSEVVINDNVTSIGMYSFGGCDNLKTITLPNNLETIGDYAFDSCFKLETITIPNDVESISCGAFQSCENLKTVHLSNRLKNIEESAFAYCSSLSNISLPDGLNSIGDYAFEECTKLNAFTIPSSVTNIDENALCNMLIDKNQFINNSILDAEENNFWGAYLYDTLIGNMYIDGHILVKYIGEDETEVEIPDCITEIGESAFSYANDLETINIPNRVTKLGEWSFANCEKLKKVTLPNNITTIPAGIFSDCHSLNEIVIPNGVTIIDDGAFAWCSELRTITIPQSVITIGNNAFEGCGLEYVDIPNSVVNIGDFSFSYCKNLVSVTLPNTMTSIPEGMFAGCSELSDITIPNSVTTINESAFSYCESLEAIIIPENVVNIGEYAFSVICIENNRFINNSSLNAEDNNYWGALVYDTFIDDFYIRDNQIIKYVGDGEAFSCTIPDGIIRIKKDAFTSSSLDEIIIPESVIDIEEDAFYDWYNLTIKAKLGFRTWI